MLRAAIRHGAGNHVIDVGLYTTSEMICSASIEMAFSGIVEIVHPRAGALAARHDLKRAGPYRACRAAGLGINQSITSYTMLSTHTAVPFSTIIPYDFPREFACYHRRIMAVALACTVCSEHAPERLPQGED
jgi:hypothetical protein